MQYNGATAAHYAHYVIVWSRNVCRNAFHHFASNLRFSGQHAGPGAGSVWQRCNRGRRGGSAFGEVGLLLLLLEPVNHIGNFPYAVASAVAVSVVISVVSAFATFLLSTKLHVPSFVQLSFVQLSAVISAVAVPPAFASAFSSAVRSVSAVRSALSPALASAAVPALASAAVPALASAAVPALASAAVPALASAAAPAGAVVPSAEVVHNKSSAETTPLGPVVGAFSGLVSMVPHSPSQEFEASVVCIVQKKKCNTHTHTTAQK